MLYGEFCSIRTGTSHPAEGATTLSIINPVSPTTIARDAKKLKRHSNLQYNPCFIAHPSVTQRALASPSSGMFALPTSIANMPIHTQHADFSVLGFTCLVLSDRRCHAGRASCSSHCDSTARYVSRRGLQLWNVSEQDAYSTDWSHIRMLSGQPQKASSDLFFRKS